MKYNKEKNRHGSNFLLKEEIHQTNFVFGSYTTLLQYISLFPTDDSYSEFLVYHTLVYRF